MARWKRGLALSLAFLPLACLGKIDASPDRTVMPGPDGGTQDAAPGSSSSPGSSSTSTSPTLPPSPPPPLAVVNGEVNAIAQDDGALYYAAEDPSVGGSSWLARVAKDGATPPVTLTGLDSAFATGIAVDATTVYWTSLAGTVWRISKQGGTPEQLAGGQGRLWGIALADTTLYWANQGSDDGSPDGSIVALDLQTKALTTLVTGSTAAPTWIAVDADAVYWSDDLYADTAPAIHRVPRSGGTPVTLSSGDVGPIVLGGGQVFWASFEGTTLWSAPATGGPQTQWGTIAAPSGGPDPAIAPTPDGHTLYWADKTGAVSLADAPGAAPRALTGAVPLPDQPLSFFANFLLLDAARVYLVEYQASYVTPQRTLILSIPR